jgi:hypothetical protein
MQGLSDSGKPVPLFDGCSNMVLTILITMFLGAEFATRHAEDLIQMTVEYENALQTPQAKLLPRWTSTSGRNITEMERRFKELVKCVTRNSTEMEKGVKTLC